MAVCEHPPATASARTAKAANASARRRFTLRHRHPRELPLPHLQQIHAGRKLCVRIGDPLPLDAHSALGDQAARLRSGRGQAELRERLRQRYRLRSRIARDGPLLHVLRDFATLVHELELFLRGPCGFRPMVPGDDLLRQLALRHLRVPAAQRFDLGQRSPREELVVPPHQPVRDAHQLPVLLLRRLGDADVVAERLAHFVAHDLAVHLSRIGPLEQRPGEAYLWNLTVLLLQLAADEEVEELVGGAELDVRLQRHRVVSLRQRIEQLVQRDRDLVLPTSLEVLPLEHASEGIPGGELDQARRPEWNQPFAVEAHLGAVVIENAEHLLLVRLGVGGDLFLAQRRTCRVAPRRISDHPGEVPDQEDDGMAQLLEAPHALERNRMSEVQIGGGGIESHLDPQRHLLVVGILQLAQQVLARVHVDRATRDFFELLLGSGLAQIRAHSDTLCCTRAMLRAWPVTSSISTIAPCRWTSPWARSNDECRWVRNRSMAFSFRSPITLSQGPHIPTSVMYAVPPRSTRSSAVCTCVCEPSTALTRPSR